MTTALAGAPANWRTVLAELPPAEAEARLAALTTEQLAWLRQAWYEVWARPSQQIPPGPWTIWLVLAGRGFGKTRAGAEFVQHEVGAGRAHRVALVARTKGDLRDTLVEGPSGLLATAKDGAVPRWVPSQRKLTWPNGAVALGYSADEPDQLRGQESDLFWADELAAWRMPDLPGELNAFDNLLLGLRAGAAPRGIVTTTPKRVALLRRILARPDVVVTGGSTYENARNLAPSFVATIVRQYEGTRLGQQELYAQLLDDNPDALWRYEWIERGRRPAAPDLPRVVVALDPAVTSTEESAETGIIVAGRSREKALYVLDDVTCTGRPHEWARVALAAYHRWEADRVVAEVNNGGDMIGAVLHSLEPGVPYTAVRATRGKAIRAEPISAIYEQGRAHHVGVFPELESQLVNWVPGDRSPDRLDALVWAATDLLIGTGWHGPPVGGRGRVLPATYRAGSGRWEI